MTRTPFSWLTEVALALAAARATLACYGVRERALEARIDAALADAVSLKLNQFRP